MQTYVEQSILRAFIMIITLGRRDRVKLNNTPALRASSTRGDKCGEDYKNAKFIKYMALSMSNDQHNNPNIEICEGKS